MPRKWAFTMPAAVWGRSSCARRSKCPGRTTDSFRTLWQLKISDPLALYVLARKVKSGDLSQVEVSYAVEGRGGPAPVKISRERMPLSDFLNTFGLTIEDVKKQLK